jgi:hypothetical protein
MIVELSRLHEALDDLGVRGGGGGGEKVTVAG